MDKFYQEDLFANCCIWTVYIACSCLIGDSIYQNSMTKYWPKSDYGEVCNHTNRRLVRRKKGTCSICLLDYDSTTSWVVPLPCNAKHLFHFKCIYEWMFMEKHPCCPLDREEITPGKVYKLVTEFPGEYWATQYITFPGFPSKVLCPVC